MSAVSHPGVVEARRHPAWRLLAAEHAPLVLSFLASVFIAPNVRSMPGPDLTGHLDDYLAVLRSDADDQALYPRPASGYLADWSKPEAGWLRRYYPPGRDVPEFEPTPAVETAVAFVQSLGPREFVGTASRLLTVRDLLRQISAGAATDAQARLAALRRQREEIDAQIAAVEAGQDGGLDDTAVRERYGQVVDTARALLRDMRAVEAGMRDLDRRVRSQATTWDGPRGELLASVFGTQASIADSDEGRSWQAFWEHLLSSRAMDELNALLDQLSTIPALDGRTGEAQALLRADLFHAAESTQRALAGLSAQLRRFLDDHHWAETRRVDALIRDVLAAGLRLAVAGTDPRDLGSELPDLRAGWTLPLERPLYTPRLSPALDAVPAVDGYALDADLTDLFEVSSIDVAALSLAVEQTVARAGGTASLGQVIAEHPLTSGLAELVGYLQAVPESAGPDGGSEQVTWVDEEDRVRVATLPRIMIGGAGDGNADQG